MNTTKFDKCFVHLANGTTVEYRNGELGFYDGLLSIWGDIHDDINNITSPVHHTYGRDQYERVDMI
jgi:hypothetical protein